MSGSVSYPLTGWSRRVLLMPHVWQLFGVPLAELTWIWRCASRGDCLISQCWAASKGQVVPRHLPIFMTFVAEDWQMPGYLLSMKKLISFCMDNMLFYTTVMASLPSWHKTQCFTLFSHQVQVRWSLTEGGDWQMTETQTSWRTLCLLSHVLCSR